MKMIFNKKQLTILYNSININSTEEVESLKKIHPENFFEDLKSNLHKLSNNELNYFFENNIVNSEFCELIVLFLSNETINPSDESSSQLNQFINRNFGLKPLFIRKIDVLCNLAFENSESPESFKHNIKVFIEDRNKKTVFNIVSFLIKYLQQRSKLHPLGWYDEVSGDFNMNHNLEGLRYEDYLDQISLLLPIEDLQKIKGNSDYTLRRKVIALYYLFVSLDLPFIDVDRTKLTAFTLFLTGRETNSPISNTNEYKIWKNLLNYKTSKKQVKDLNFVKKHFEEIGLYHVAEIIRKDLEN